MRGCPEVWQITKPSQSEFNRSDVNSKQILAIMRLLRYFKVVDKDLTDKALAECFGTLAGYSGDQFRKKSEWIWLARNTI